MSLSLPSTLTPSKISAFTSCPLAFRFSVVERLPEAPSSQAVKGTLVHKALQLLYSERPAGERHRAEAEAALLRAWQWLRETAEFEGLSLDEGDRLAFLREASSLLDHYYELEDPDSVTAVGLELDLHVEVDGIVLRGIIDRLDRMPDGSFAVVDYKTGRAPRAEHSRSRLSSLQLYAFLCERTLGFRPAVVRLVYLKDRVVVSADTTDQSLRGVHQRACAVWAAITRACERSDFRPNPSALCNYCSYHDYCPVFGGRPELAAERRSGSPAGVAPAAGMGPAVAMGTAPVVLRPVRAGRWETLAEPPATLPA